MLGGTGGAPLEVHLKWWRFMSVFRRHVRTFYAEVGEVYVNVYLALCDFAQRFFEKRSPGREKVFLGVVLQAAVATAHGALPRHWRGHSSRLQLARIKLLAGKRKVAIHLKSKPKRS